MSKPKEYKYFNLNKILQDESILDELSNNEIRDLQQWISEPYFDIKQVLNYNAVIKMFEKGYIKQVYKNRRYE